MTKHGAKKSSVAVRNAATGKYLATGLGKFRLPDVPSLPELKVASKLEADDSAVMSLAARIAGSKPVADRWYARPNDLLGGRTPERAVRDGDGERVVGLLLNVAGQ